MIEHQIPIVDIEPFLKGSLKDKQQVADQIATACETVGFLMITGHGIPESVVHKVLQISSEFFDLPLEVKEEIVTPEDVTRGYVPFGGETLSYSLDQVSPPDLKEFFLMGPVQYSNDSYFSSPEASYFFEPNRFPRQPQQFQSVLVDYYLRMEALATTLMHIFALGLHLPETFFDDKIDKHVSEMGSFHYPAQTEEPLPGQLRAGAHTDYGSLTILYPDDAPGGLQILTPANTWMDVNPVPGAFIINLGDLMARWTNDRWKSTLHRVVNPLVKGARNRRQSIAFFHQPNYDALITCLEGCYSADDPPRYAPITAGENTFIKSGKHRSTATEPLTQKQAQVETVV